MRDSFAPLGEDRLGSLTGVNLMLNFCGHPRHLNPSVASDTSVFLQTVLTLDRILQ